MSSESPLWCRSDNNGVVLELRVIPRCAKSGPTGVHADRLKWGVHSAAHDGKANEELISSVASALRVSKSSVSIRRGERSREKTVAIEGVTLDAVMQLIVATTCPPSSSVPL